MAVNTGVKHDGDQFGIAEGSGPKRFKPLLRLLPYCYRETGVGCVVAKV